MSTLIISGSQRSNSQSDRIAKLIQDRLEKQKVVSSILSLARNPVPLWEEEVFSQNSSYSSHWKPFSNQIRSADAYVLVSPEWAGMVPPALKNLLLLATQGEMAHKPVLLVCISSGTGGSYPLVELRMSGYKNSKYCVIPEHIILRSVETFCPQGIPANSDQEKMLARIDFCLMTLGAYATALKTVREQIGTQERSYPYGM